MDSELPPQLMFWFVDILNVMERRKLESTNSELRNLGIDPSEISSTPVE